MRQVTRRLMSIRRYYRALAGESQARRLVQLPPIFAAEVGEPVRQRSDGSIVEIWIGTEELYGSDVVRSKRTGLHQYRYTLIDPLVRMSDEPHVVYVDNNRLYLVPWAKNNEFRARWELDKSPDLEI